MMSAPLPTATRAPMDASPAPGPMYAAATPGGALPADAANPVIVSIVTPPLHCRRRIVRPTTNEDTAILRPSSPRRAPGGTVW